MRKHVVRLVLPDGVHEASALLRTVVLVMHRAGSVTIHRDDIAGMCFDVLPPAGVDTHVWAESVAKDFQHYHFNAVVALEQPCGIADTLALPPDQQVSPTFTSTPEELVELDRRLEAIREWGQHCLR